MESENFDAAESAAAKLGELREKEILLRNFAVIESN